MLACLLPCLLFVAAPVAAQIKVGAEFQVNDYTPSSQHRPEVSFDSDGDFVVVWFDSYSVVTRSFSADGVAVASEFEVNSITAGGAQSSFLSISHDAQGDFVVAWPSAGPHNNFGGVLARRFSSTGIALGEEFVVNAYSTSVQSGPSVSLDADGDFVIVWESNGQDGSEFGVFARRFSSEGVAQAAEFQVSTHTTNHQHQPSLALEADGDFIVAWTSLSSEVDCCIFARRFSSTGAAQAVEFRVNTHTFPGQGLPTVALDAEGDFVIAWESGAQDGDSSGIFARRFSADGSPLAAEFQVNTHTVGSQTQHSLSVDADGNFVVTWASGEDGSDFGVFGRRFASSGVAQASEFQINSHTTDGQTRPAVSLDADGDFVVAWQSIVQDGSGFGVFAQRFAVLTGLETPTPTFTPTPILPPTPTPTPVPGVERIGPEFQVNSYTPTGQGLASVSLDNDGDFVVAWIGADGMYQGILARQFSSDGVAQTEELQVNTYTTNSQVWPAVSLDADGDFVVAWDSIGQDGSSSGNFARRFSSSGVPQAAEFQVNSRTTDQQRYPSVSLDADGDFVIAWQSRNQDGAAEGVFARRFNSSGVALDHEFQVNTRTFVSQYYASVSLDADGDFVVAWAGGGQDGSQLGVFARSFTSSGVAQAVEFQASSFTLGPQTRPSVALDADGDFVIAWESSQDGSLTGVFARRFSSSGSALAAEFQVNSFTPNHQTRPKVSVDADGDFVVVWASAYQDADGSGVFARRFNSDGVAQAVEFQLSSFTTDDQLRPSVSLDADGDFVVVWDSFQDGDSLGVFAQRFSPEGDDDTDGVPDGVEDSAPNSGDGNDDGTPDSEQANVASLPNTIDGQYVTLACPSGTTLVDVQSIDPATLPPPPAAAGEFPIGVLSFKVVGVIPGGTVDVDLFLPAGLTLSSYYKFGSESGTPADHWYEFLNDGSTGAVFATNKVTLTLVDGDRGDDDLTADGVIVEPGGPVNAVTVNLDIDGDGEAVSLTDGLLVIRSMFGFTGTTLTSGAVDIFACSRCDAAAIEPYLEGLGLLLDVDDDDQIRALTDGLLVLRYLFGFTDTTLTAGAINVGGCTRCDAAAIEPYLDGLMP